ncbi:hypothetical protein AVEN_41282-1 [Araneus ventricosus]|uniref:Uncharacterized protein n=1 Tax=Araneus ventricosus TaxID=182803 RepID=A0A4Y2S7P6_ARAVE|nr:hypothetical protein AVEN_41282-1 [Araneus ventricosus]
MICFSLPPYSLGKEKFFSRFDSYYLCSKKGRSFFRTLIFLQQFVSHTRKEAGVRKLVFIDRRLIGVASGQTAEREIFLFSVISASFSFNFMEECSRTSLIRPPSFQGKLAAHRAAVP